MNPALTPHACSLKEGETLSVKIPFKPKMKASQADEACISRGLRGVLLDPPVAQTRKRRDQMESVGRTTVDADHIG